MVGWKVVVSSQSEPWDLLGDCLSHDVGTVIPFLVRHDVSLIHVKEQ